jgi:hypothetical protein
MSCGTQHKQAACPKCGSKMKRVGSWHAIGNWIQCKSRLAERSPILVFALLHQLEGIVVERNVCNTLLNISGYCTNNAWPTSLIFTSQVIMSTYIAHILLESGYYLYSCRADLNQVKLLHDLVYLLVFISRALQFLFSAVWSVGTVVRLATLPLVY